MKTNKVIFNFLLIFLVLLTTFASLQAQETISLKEIINASIEHSKKIKISEKKYQKAEFSKKRAFRSYVPSLTAEAGYTILNDDIVFPDDLNTLLKGTQWLMIKEQAGLPFNQQPTPQIMAMLAQNGISIKETPPIKEKNYFSANVTAQMVLFSGMKIPYSIKAAEHQMNMQSLLTEQEKTNLTAEVIKYYDKFAVVAKSEEVLASSEKYLNEQTRFVQKAYENGLAIELDLQKIELAKQELKAKQIELSAAKSLLMAKLSQLSGLETSILQNVNPTLEIWNVTQVNENISQRKDIQALDEAIQATDYKRKIELTENLPKIVAFGKKELITESLSIFDPEWAVGIKLKWNIFDGLTSSTKVQQAKLDKLILEEKKNEAIELLELKRTNSDLELTKNNQLLKVSAQKVKISEKTYNLSQKQLNVGLITLNEHLKTLNDVELARLDYIQAVYNQRMSVLDLLETSGDLNIDNFPN